MLEKLIIENIALIERLELELGAGFTVLTGETGAGKSIIIDAVNLVLGERANKDLISFGSQKARAEAFFNISDCPAARELLSEMQIEPDDDSLVISREINVQGKSVCRVCGEVVQLSALKRLTKLLVDVHGQHEHQSLLDEKTHINVTDAYNGDEISPLLAEIGGIYTEYAEVCAKLNSGFISEAERERRIDILKYQINEIESAKLKPNEEAAIAEELKLLTNAERISQSISTGVSSLLGDGGIENIKKAADALGDISEFSEAFAECAKRLNDLYYELEDAAYTVRDLRYESDFDPRRIDALETRLDVIDGLKHKYGRTVEEVLSFCRDAKNELENLTGSAEQRNALLKLKEELRAKYKKSAEKLTAARRRSAETLCAMAQDELSALGMKNAVLSARFGIVDEEPHPDGSDVVELLLSANEGEPLKPLSKVASGGELSRIMLALKTVITGADGIGTLIFDEVDTGISGNTANIVGLRIKKIAQTHQVLCVTHLPQIAAFADEHFLVEKNTSDGRTHTSVKALSNEERVAELARIMGADAASGAAKAHASELIEKAKKAQL